MPLTLDNLNRIVDSREFEKLVGEIENEFFDAKGRPYQFDAGDYWKRELAKDVTAFANAAGGYIFLGLGTEPATARFGEAVKELRPIPRELIDPDRHHKVISEWVYPEPRGLRVDWLPHGSEGKGIGVSYIPRQDEQSKPFLITKSIEGTKTTEAVIAYAERRRDSTNTLSVIEIHHALRLGLNLEGEILKRIENIESLIEGRFEAAAQAESGKRINENVRERIETALQHDDMRNERTLILVACPTTSGSLKTIFSKSEGSIRRALEQPPALRYSGWDLGTLDQAQFVKGERIRVVSGDRKVIDLYRDGYLVFVGLANRHFLAWSRDNDLQLNPLALIELVVNFARFYSLVLKDLAEPPKEVIFHFEFRNLHTTGGKSFLVPYGIQSINLGAGWGSKEAPEGSCVIERRVSVEGYDPERVAYELIREIYYWFGHEGEVIPYTKVEDGQKKIDVAQIAGL